MPVLNLHLFAYFGVAGPCGAAFSAQGGRQGTGEEHAATLRLRRCLCGEKQSGTEGTAEERGGKAVKSRVDSS